MLCRVEDAATAKGVVKGGALINTLCGVREHFRGDAKAWKLCDSLVQRAAVPYMMMLKHWICDGDLSGDTCGEFMVEEKADITKEDLIMDYLNEYWEQKYAIRLPMVPVFLDHFKHKILTAGKYLSVLRECSPKAKKSQSEEADEECCVADEDLLVSNDDAIVNCHAEQQAMSREEKSKKVPGNKSKNEAVTVTYSNDDREMERAVSIAHTKASKDLLSLLLGPLKLQEALLSMKHFFLGDQGDFLSQFLEVFSPVLRLKTAEVSLARLNALLDRVFRTSQLDRDIFRDKIRCVYISQSIGKQLVAINGLAVTDDLTLVPGISPKDEDDPKQLPVMNALAFDCNVDFPLSLVVSRGSVAKYQILQRFTLLMRYVESRLNFVWSLHMGSRMLNSLLKPVFFVRHKMCMFVKAFLSFVCNEVIEPGWSALVRRIRDARNFDDVLRAHIDFLDSCLLESTLTDLNLIQNATFILNLCLEYVSFAESMDKELEETLWNTATEETATTEEQSQLSTPTRSPMSVKRTLSPTSKEKANSNQMNNMFHAAEKVVNAKRGTIRDYDERFNDTLKRFISGLRSYATNGSTKIGYLISELDFTNFYSDLPF